MAMNSILRALGFRSHDDDELDDLSDCPSALPIQSHASQPDTPSQIVDEEISTVGKPTSVPPSPEIEPLKQETAFPLTIFDSLLEVFNEAQPDFIRKCLDMDAQRRYLYDTVDSSFRDYISRIKAAACREAERDRDSEHRRMMEEIDSLRAQVKDTGKTAEELKALRLSADRQKRTFNERIRDLEQQVAGAMAEKEQYDLEVKSLMNKLKVQQVQQKDIEDLEDLRTRLAEANKQITAMNAANAMSENAEATLRKEADALRARVAELTSELESAKAVNASNEVETSPSEADVQLKNRLIEAEATMKAAEERMIAAESRTRELQARLDEAEKKLRDSLSDDGAPFGAIASSAHAMELPEGDVHADGNSIPVSVEEPPAESASSSKKRRGRPKKNMPRISAIDESMDSTEWLVATPPEGANLKVAVATDPDFGYQEPPRKPKPPQNDAQMLLF